MQSQTFSGYGGPNTHPAPLEAMQRMRLLLLGKHARDLIKNPSVRIEPEENNEEFVQTHSRLTTENNLTNNPAVSIESGESDEELEQTQNRLRLENDVFVATQSVTLDATVTIIEIDTGHENIEDVVEPPTPQEMYEKKISCSYQVKLTI